MNHQGSICTNNAIHSHRGRISHPNPSLPPTQRRFLFVLWLSCLGGVVLNNRQVGVLATAAAGRRRSNSSSSSRRSSANVQNTVLPLHTSTTVLLLPRGGDDDNVEEDFSNSSNSNSNENDKEEVLTEVVDVVMDSAESTTTISAGVKTVDNEFVEDDDDKDKEKEDAETQQQETTTIITVEDDEGDEDKEGQESNVRGDDNHSDTEAVVTLEMEKADATATELRLEGKEYHDSGDFGKAAELFKSAADTLLAAYTAKAATQSSLPLPEDYATCRLHEALCHLKSEEYDLCVEACTDVLQDGVVVDDIDDDDHDEDDNEEEEAIPAGRKSSVDPSNFSPAIRGRAHHRRAKAKLALGDNAGALQDARTGAFLGDGKAVGLYGKLMRESTSLDITSALNPLLGSSSAFPSPDTSLLESLLQKSIATNNGGLSPLGDINPLSMLIGGNDGPAGMLGALAAGKGISGGLAKSVLSNLSKRLDDEATQETICNFLQKTNKAQLGGLASMAGVDNALDDSLLDRIVGFCHGVTPRGIRRTVKATKATAYMVKVVRRVMKLINKYKTLLVAVFILQWAKSATLRPIPISKAAKKAAKQATKQALNDALKNSR